MQVLLLAWAGAGAAEELQPIVDTDYHYAARPEPEQVELGRLLFYDKILSGNRNISCATCHHPVHQTGDGLALSIGEGGSGLGTERDGGTGTDVARMRIGRNAQPLFNLGAKHFTVMFHDGRVEADPSNTERLLTPIGDELPEGLDNVLAAQALFPVVSADEMAGQRGENEIADAVSVDDVHKAWRLLEERINLIPEYASLSIVDVANAIAAFTTVEWRADRSPFDAYLRGNKESMTAEQTRGMALFYGDAGCGECHSGVLQTDMRFHSVAMPQVGPGKGHGFDGHDDFGREAVTGNPADRYRFRTPSLRNVSETGPWGHDGAFDTLEAVVRHHLDPVESLQNYRLESPLAPSRPDLDGRDNLVQSDAMRRSAIAVRNELGKRALTDAQVGDLLTFLNSLSDQTSLTTDANVPATVPSGLPVED